MHQFYRRVVCTGILALLGIGTAAAQSPYLALGDSIPFGFNPTVPLAPPAPPTFLSNFHGYPQLLAPVRGLNLTNASCPGESSGSFISITAPDNGCKEWREFLPLFVTYGSTQTQLQYAISYLQANPKTKLVTIEIGGDDLLLLEESCATQVNPTACANAGLGSALLQYGANLVTIYEGIRNTAHYQGPIIAVNYFSPNYRDSLETNAVRALNTVTLGVTLAFRGKVADAFTAFDLATLGSGGLPCKTGIPLAYPGATAGTCDVHPTLAGHKLIEDVVLLTMLL